MADAGQLNFDFDPPVSIQERFEDFHRAHPEVYEYLVQLTLELWRAGRTHYGIKALWERVRFHFSLEQDASEDFKLNNNYTSRYVRLMVHEYPEFEGMFETRELKAP